MTPEELTDHVTDETRTELSRLGSSKALYADTAGDLDPQTVLIAAADAEYHAAETYRHWADTDPAAPGRDVWTRTAEEEADHYDRVTAALDTDHDPGDPPTIHTHLRGLTAPIDRAGAFLGRTIAATRSKDQYTGYFVGQGTHDLADLFRDLSEDLDTQRDRGHDLLTTLCSTDAEWDAAATAAITTIEVAYDAYVDTLEGMGVNPKPVC